MLKANMTMVLMLKLKNEMALSTMIMIPAKLRAVTNFLDFLRSKIKPIKGAIKSRKPIVARMDCQIIIIFSSTQYIIESLLLSQLYVLFRQVSERAVQVRQ